MHQEIQQNQQQTKFIALLLAVLSAISIFAMLHHPSIAAHEVQAQIDEINQESLINGLVHGSLVGIIVLISFCLTCYAQLKGLMRPSVLAGLVVYWIGTVVMINAGLISGFVVPHLATMVDLTSTSELNIFTGLRRLSWAMNQAFANFGSVCWCLTMCFWAKAIYDGEVSNKIFAILSFIAGAFLAIALLTGWISLTVLGMTIVMLVISVWHLGIAWLLYAK